MAVEPIGDGRNELVGRAGLSRQEDAPSVLVECDRRPGARAIRTAIVPGAPQRVGRSRPQRRQLPGRLGAQRFADITKVASWRGEHAALLAHSLFLDVIELPL